MKEFKWKNKSYVWLIGVVIAGVLHNIVSRLIGREEAVFFGLTFIYGLGFLIMILYKWLKNYLLMMFVLMLLALDLAAVNDILNKEPQAYEEYVVLGVSVIVWMWLIKKRKKK